MQTVAPRSRAIRQRCYRSTGLCENALDLASAGRPSVQADTIWATAVVVSSDRPHPDRSHLRWLSTQVRIREMHPPLEARARTANRVTVDPWAPWRIAFAGSATSIDAS